MRTCGIFLFFFGKVIITLCQSSVVGVGLSVQVVCTCIVLQCAIHDACIVPSGCVSDCVFQFVNLFSVDVLHC